VRLYDRLFRDPSAAPHLLKLSTDPSADVRYWAVRGLVPAVVDPVATDRTAAIERLRLLSASDRDRRVRTEALRALLQFDDERAFTALVNALYSTDTWISVSAAEAVARFPDRARVLASVLVDISESAKAPTALRIVSLQALTTLAPDATKTFELAAALAKSPVFAARSAAVQALGRLGDEGRTLLTALADDPAVATLAQPGGQTFEAMARAQIARGAGGRGGGGRGGRGAQTSKPARPVSEYRALVERWIVPAYNGAPAPRAIWETPRGTIEIELHAGDAPLGAEHFLRVVESGDIVGTEFTRLVPNFVAQQQAIRNATTLRDEVNQRGLTRANVSWASAGLGTRARERRENLIRAETATSHPSRTMVGWRRGGLIGCPVVSGTRARELCERERGTGPPRASWSTMCASGSSVWKARGGARRLPNAHRRSPNSSNPPHPPNRVSSIGKSADVSKPCTPSCA
jgi:hypothetical protein